MAHKLFRALTLIPSELLFTLMCEARLAENTFNRSRPSSRQVK
jgi:hypothetical protein